jgi:hypothetical protein
MLLRICLIVAVVGGLGAVGLIHTKLKDKIGTISTERDNNAQERDRFQQESNKAKQAERKAKEERDDSNQQLATATNELIIVTAKATEQEKRANDLSGRYNVTLKERNEAQAQLAAWNVLGVTPGQVEEIKDSLKNITAERDAVTAEKEIITKDNKRLTAELRRLIGPDEKVKLPEGLKGKVIAVDPQWQFVVLNIGSDQGVLEHGEMLVNRNGKLVAKVRISSVETNRCIANVLPEWKQEDVTEGDQVLY